MTFENVTANPKANIYFDGKVISHGITLADGSTKSFGIIFAGEYHFGTEKAERMEITDGSCAVKQDGTGEVSEYKAGEYFDVPANSGFTITVLKNTTEYICSYIDQ